MIPISVVIPVGPKDVHQKWLPEMLSSISKQTLQPEEVILISDGGDLNKVPWGVHMRAEGYIGIVRVWQCPWNIGPAACMNFGVALAKNDLVLMACADDRLMPRCIELCWQAWNKFQNPLGYYYLGVKYSNDAEQNVACGAAMVTKTLWAYTGGFPVQCSVGAADHIFLSALIAGSRDGYSEAQILRVSDELTYWYRLHDETETSKNIWPAVEAVRDWFTVNWRPRHVDSF